jgi:hypothetical protein
MKIFKKINLEQKNKKKSQFFQKLFFFKKNKPSLNLTIHIQQ